MKPTLHIETDELIEYRDELNEIITQYERLNKNWDAKIIKLEEAGHSPEVVNSILSIFFEDVEANDDE